MITNAVGAYYFCAFIQVASKNFHTASNTAALT